MSTTHLENLHKQRSCGEVRETVPAREDAIRDAYNLNTYVLCVFLVKTSWWNSDFKILDVSLHLPCLCCLTAAIVLQATPVMPA